MREIASVKLQTSNPSELLKWRPLRRITISGEEINGEIKLIDVSLKHFATTDIRELVQAIHTARPDLSLPAAWLPGL